MAPAPPEQLVLDFGEEKMEVEPEAAKQIIAARERTKPDAEKNHKGRVTIPEGLPRVKEVIEPQEDTSGMKRIGEDVTEILEITPERMWVRRIVRPRYARTDAAQQEIEALAAVEGKTVGGQAVQAPLPDTPFPRLKAGVSMLVHILVAKYVHHLLLYRIAQQFARHQTKIPDSALGPKIFLVNCMAHIRREFFEAKGNDDTRANTTLTLIQQLYKVEQEARELQLSAEERGKLRLEKSTGPFSEFKKWCIDEYQKVLPQSAMGKAITYALRRMDNMALYLVYGDIEIDNNLVENIIRPVAIGRKNCLFAGSHEPAQRTAMLYTFFALCKHHQINPEEWLQDVLNRIAFTKPPQLPQLLPPFWKPEV